MERALKNYLYIIILSLLMFNCKTDKKTPVVNDIKQLLSKKTDTIKTVKYDKFIKENPNCLKERDTLEIKKMRKKIAKAIIQKDTLAIVNFIQYADMDKNITNEAKKQSLDYSDYRSIMELCLKEVMPEYVLEDLNGESYFDEKEGSKGCFTYKINNHFPERELTLIFIFEKINGYIKLVDIKTGV